MHARCMYINTPITLVDAFATGVIPGFNFFVIHSAYSQHDIKRNHHWGLIKKTDNIKAQNEGHYS